MAYFTGSQRSVRLLEVLVVEAIRLAVVQLKTAFGIVALPLVLALACGSAALRLKDYLILSSGAKDFRSDEERLSYMPQFRGSHDWSLSDQLPHRRYLVSCISFPQITPQLICVCGKAEWNGKGG